MIVYFQHKRRRNRSPPRASYESRLPEFRGAHDADPERAKSHVAAQPVETAAQERVDEVHREPAQSEKPKQLMKNYTWQSPCERCVGTCFVGTRALINHTNRCLNTILL